jgi:nitrate/nitrite transporter NarK
VRRLPWLPLPLAAAIWALYDTAFAMVFSFGPLLLEQRGLSVTTASAIISTFIIATGVILPLGGLIADRTGGAIRSS